MIVFGFSCVLIIWLIIYFTREDKSKDRFITMTKMIIFSVIALGLVGVSLFSPIGPFSFLFVAIILKILIGILGD